MDMHHASHTHPESEDRAPLYRWIGLLVALGAVREAAGRERLRVPLEVEDDLVTGALSAGEPEPLGLGKHPDAVYLGYGSGLDNPADCATILKMVLIAADRDEEVALARERHLQNAPAEDVRLHAQRQEAPRELVLLENVVCCRARSIYRQIA